MLASGHWPMFCGSTSAAGWASLLLQALVWVAPRSAFGLARCWSTFAAGAAFTVVNTPCLPYRMASLWIRHLPHLPPLPSNDQQMWHPNVVRSLDKTAFQKKKTLATFAMIRSGEGRPEMVNTTRIHIHIHIRWFFKVARSFFFFLLKSPSRNSRIRNWPT